MTKSIREHIHTKKFHNMAEAIKRKGGDVNPYAVAMAKLGRNRAVKKEHRMLKGQVLGKK